jgi:all-trans-retinol dehydrogenase (NAD+)
MLAKYRVFFLNLLIAILLLVWYTLVSAVRFLVPSKFRAKSVRNKNVLITGAGSGLGKLMAIKFASLGARVAIVDVNEKDNKRTEIEIAQKNGFAMAFTCDLSNRDDVYRLVNRIKNEFGSVDILVNNAGIVTGKKLLDSSDEAIEKTFQVNTFSHFWVEFLYKK